MVLKAPSPAFLRRWGVQVAMGLPLAVLLVRWGLLIAGGDSRALGLTAEPVDATINTLGLWAIRALCLTLAITPLRKWTRWQWLAAWRRPIGLWCFAYASLHLVVYFGLDLVGLFSELVKDVIKHKFILLGMAGWLMLLPLAITSTRGMIKRVGAKRWQRLHRAVYAVAVVVAIHFIQRVKGFQIEPWIYASVLAFLLLARVRWRGLIPQPARA